MPLIAGKRFGPYEIVSLLGAGGMGEVYRARDPRLEREVALKVLPEHLASERESLARFEREAKAVAALAHPNVVVLYDCGTQEGVFFVVMELLGGESLRKRLARGPIPWPQALEMSSALADGLFAAHTKGIVHRDLKPENIFITPEGRIKILDFGLARLEGRSQPTLPASPSAAVRDTRMDLGELTTDKIDPNAAADTLVPANDERSTLMGTVGYMSPEHVRGEVVDARTDLFSLGCVLYEMISGRRAFARTTPAETLHSVLVDEPPDIVELQEEVPADVSQVIRRCLAKKQEDRYPSARDVGQDLRRILEDHFRPRPRRLWGVGTWALGFLLTGVLVLALYLFGQRTSGSTAVDSIAVLPLISTSDDHRARYLSDGLTESLINSLTQGTELHVLSRTSVERYRKPERDPQEAGQQLGVRIVVHGKVSLEGEQLTISVEMLDVQDQRSLWGERFVRKVSDLQSMEREIAAEIAAKLRLKLSGAHQERLAKPATSDPEAYELYVKGRFFWNKRTEDGLIKAIDCFRQAVQRDKQFALAHAGLADCHCTMGSYGFIAPDQAFPQAEASARQALALDPTLAEPRAALALVRELYVGDLRGALAEYELALEANPKHATSHQWYAFCLAELNRLEEAKAAIRKAQELEPLSLSINSGHGWILYLARDYDGAIAQLTKTLEMEPHFGAALSTLGLAQVEKGQVAEGLRTLERARLLSPKDAETLGYLGHILGRNERREEAQRLIVELEMLGKVRYVSSYHQALIHAGLGERDQAFACLERAFQERACALASIKVLPLLDPLRKDPRFVELVRRIELPP